MKNKILNFISTIALMSAGSMASFLLLGNDMGWKITLTICVVALAFGFAIISDKKLKKS